MADKKTIAKDILIAALAAGAAYGLYRWLRGSAQRTSLPNSDAEAFAAKALNDLIAKVKLDPAGPGELGKIDRHKAFFLFQRLRDLAAADPASVQGEGIALKTRVERELSQIDAFLAEKLGTESARGPYYGGSRGPETREAGHLDLGWYVSQRIDDPEPTTEADAVAAAKKSQLQAHTLRELDRRRMRVIGITCRAAAIDTDVWKGSGTDSTLQKPELTELLDRRLRSVERLQYEASAGANPNGIGSSFIDREWGHGNSNPRGKTNASGQMVDDHGNVVTDPQNQAHDPQIWEDDYKVRIFERPSIPRAAASDTGLSEIGWEVEGFLKDTNALETDPGVPRFGDKDWYLNHATGELDWNKWPGSRFADVRDWDPLSRVVSIAWDLVPDDGGKRGYAWVMKKEHGRDQAADFIRSLFVAARDWWQRTWLHSDGVLAALHVEALQFAKHRLKDDTLFNSLPDRAALALDDYFQVRPRIASAHNGIMQSGRTLHFENASIPLDDLQIGDQVLFDTSPVLFALGSTMWDYPTALVTELDTSAEGRALDLRELKTQGFDTADLNYPSFQVVLTKTVDRALAGVREFITTELEARKAATPQGTPFIPPTKLKWDPGLVNPGDIAVNDVAILRHWNPYGEIWNEPGPWWIWINLLAQTWAGGFSSDVNKVLSRTPGGIVWTPDNRLLFEYRGQVDLSETIPVGAGFQPPPWDSATVQADPRQAIFVPLFEPFGGWVSYFYDKASHPNAKFGPHMDPVQSDARWLPGLSTTGSGKVRAIRPRLEPRLSPQP
jgi:hypothetical protein